MCFGFLAWLDDWRYPGSQEFVAHGRNIRMPCWQVCMWHSACFNTQWHIHVHVLITDTKIYSDTHTHLTLIMYYMRFIFAAYLMILHAKLSDNDLIWEEKVSVTIFCFVSVTFLLPQIFVFIFLNINDFFLKCNICKWLFKYLI